MSAFVPTKGVARIANSQVRFRAITSRRKKIMKKLVTASAIAFAAVLAITGCSASTTTSASPASSSAAVGPTTAPAKKAPAAPAKPAAPTLTASQEQALIAAKNYLKIGSGFSYQGLIDQLDSSAGNGFSVADATAAVNALGANYNEQAAIAAKNYLKLGTGFSHASLVAQLDSAAGNKFTPAQAEYGTTAAGL
jgi:hypothetical protein